MRRRVEMSQKPIDATTVLKGEMSMIESRKKPQRIKPTKANVESYQKRAITSLILLYFNTKQNGA